MAKKFYIKNRNGIWRKLVYLTAIKSVKLKCLMCKSYRSRDVDDCMDFICGLRRFRKGRAVEYSADEMAVRLSISEHCRHCSDSFQNVAKCEEDLCPLRYFRGYAREPVDESEVID